GVIGSNPVESQLSVSPKLLDALRVYWRGLKRKPTGTYQKLPFRLPAKGDETGTKICRDHEQYELTQTHRPRRARTAVVTSAASGCRSPMSIPFGNICGWHQFFRNDLAGARKETGASRGSGPAPTLLIWLRS